MTRQSIFDYLIDKNICFSVCVSTNEANNSAITANSKDYFLIVKSRDIGPKVKHRWQFKCNNEFCSILQRDLNSEEVIEFKTMSEMFTKVIHTRHGRVYELKSESFKRCLEADRVVYE